ncbi:hypothetical protein D3C72_2578060 [compost metagenome]
MQQCPVLAVEVGIVAVAQAQLRQSQICIEHLHPAQVEGAQAVFLQGLNKTLMS